MIIKLKVNGEFISGNTIKKNKTRGEWKTHLTDTINFISFKEDSDGTRTMRTKNDNIEIMVVNETDEIIEKLFDSLLERYQEGLEESMRRCEFIFDSVDALYDNLNKTSLKRGVSYIDSPEWLEAKKVTINPKNNDGKCFQYALAACIKL